MRRLAPAFAIWLAWASAALPGEPLAEASDPFAQVAPSIAKLGVAGFGTQVSCTAVQFGPSAALTARYCLRSDQASANPHLLFGYDRGRWREHRVGRRMFSDPAHGELVLLCLDKPLPPSRFGDADEPVESGTRAITAGFVEPKYQKLTFHGCSVGRSQRGMTLLRGCDLGPGSAGGPAFTLGKAGARLLGVVISGNSATAAVLAWTGKDPSALCASGKQ